MVFGPSISLNLLFIVDLVDFRIRFVSMDSAEDPKIRMRENGTLIEKFSISLLPLPCTNFVSKMNYGFWDLSETRKTG